MLLQRFTEKGRGTVAAATLLVMLLVAGCGGSGPVKDYTDAAAPEPSAGAVEGAETGPVIPPAALTLFEQATASMAAGDYVDAELRFKEFLLQYPAFPGAQKTVSTMAL